MMKVFTEELPHGRQAQHANFIFFLCIIHQLNKTPANIDVRKTKHLKREQDEWIVAIIESNYLQGEDA